MTTNPMLKANSWRNYYHAHPDTDASNLKLAGLGDFFAASAADKDPFHDFRLNKDIFLIGAKPNGRKLQLFHQGDIISGSRLNPDNICVALTGHGATAQVIKLQGGESFTSKMFRPPPLANIIKEAGSLQTFKALAATQPDAEVAIKSMIIIPQLLAEAFMACDKRDPATSAFNFRSAMGLRDAAMALTSPTADMSLINCTYTLQFCWAALNKHIARVIYSIADSSFIIAWGEELHSRHII
jgi:hypothetical protein